VRNELASTVFMDVRVKKGVGCKAVAKLAPIVESREDTTP
jgi:hypothetical protein